MTKRYTYANIFIVALFLASTIPFDVSASTTKKNKIKIRIPFFRITKPTPKVALTTIQAVKLPVQIEKKIPVLETGPCSKPITYSFGNIDSRFNISTSTLITLTSDATKIWDNQANKKLFTFVPFGGDIMLNFIYDTRQSSTDALILSKQKIDAKKEIFDQKQAEYNTKSTTFNNQKIILQNDFDGYSRKVDAFNKKYGTTVYLSRDLYSQYSVEKKILEDEITILNKRQKDLQFEVESLNAFGETLSEYARDLNNEVSNYNTIITSRSDSFLEGQYVLDQDGKRIDVFEFKNNLVLTRLLSHEFGHALGLEHVTDESAIMYKVNTGESLLPTPADTKALNSICRII